MMLKMIIADDEEIVREGLSSVIPWHDYGVEIIGLAEDGEEAYRMCQELKPDILCTDIRMPLMDGLGLAYKLKEEENSSIRIILVSGVQDFEYAKTALRVEAEAYILKPVKIQEITEVIQKVVTSIELERSSRSNHEQLRKQLQDSMPVLREKLLAQLISGHYAHEATALEKAEFYHIPYTAGDAMAVGVLQLDDLSHALQTFSEENIQLIFFAIHNVVEELIRTVEGGFLFTNTLENELVIFFNEKMLASSRFVELSEEITRCVKQYVKVSVSIGIGSEVRSLTQLSLSYQEAKSALQYTFFSGKGSIVTIDDVDQLHHAKNENYMHLYSLEKQLMIMLKLGDTNGVKELSHKLFEEVILPSGQRVDQVYYLCTELVFHLARTFHELDESFEHIVSSSISDVLQMLEGMRNIDTLRAYLESMLLDISAYFNNKHHSKNQKVVYKIKQHIEKHYMNNITIQSLAEEVYLSPTYMCQIFKKENHDTIIEYLTKVRVEKAKELMKSPDLKLFEIAEMVGFENATYFTTVFKKLTGILPGKYRETL